MVRFYLLVVFLTTSLPLYAQKERVITGQLKSTEDGSPMPGVNVTIKGTNIGTVTDAEGRYSLSAPVGSTLVFSFIGMKTREVLVTESGLQSTKREMIIRTKPANQEWRASIMNDSHSDGIGIATLSQNSPTYQSRGTVSANNILSIRRNLIQASNQKKFVVSTLSNSPKGFGLQFSSVIGFEQVGKLPALQSSFAQGSNPNGTAIWRGPDKAETMSWGPSIKTLEYSSNFYPYDKNGTIVPGGSGSGKQVKINEPYDFFRTGISTANEITMWFPGLSKSIVSLDWSQKTNRGVVPNNNSTVSTISMNMKQINISNKFTAEASFLFNSSDGRLMNRGANRTTMIGSLMQTPATFDLTNGYSTSNAVERTNVYRLPDGSVRSAAPGAIDNPYGLVNELPDNEKSYRLVASTGFNYEANKLTVNVGGTFEKQNVDILHGIAPGLSGEIVGRRTQRLEEKATSTFRLSSLYRFGYINLDGDLSVGFGYQFRQESAQVSRTDGFRYNNNNFNIIEQADSIHRYGFSLTREIHEIMAKAQYEVNGFDFQFINRNYFSNTANGSYVNLFPSVIVKADLVRLLDIGINELKPHVSIARTIRESPAIFGNNAVLSTQLNSQKFNRYFENKEIVWNNQLAPETEIKFETGLRLSTYSNVQFDFSYYNNFTFGFILPTWQQNQPVLQNSAIVNNLGTNASIAYHPYSYKIAKWGVTVRWTSFNSVVTSLDVPAQIIPLAGFSNIQTVATKGEPLGAIYGTIFLKDDKGQTVVGVDGFPLVDVELKKIGNPIPHFLISLEPYLSIKERFRIGFILDFKNGGQVWNGTKAALNYLGRSQESADQRGISNYIYDGVSASGVVNTIPVSFYNPANSLQENKWVRYGYSGIGEEHIEDATWIRLNEVSATYNFFLQMAGRKKELSIKFVGKNLFLITPYSGVDPGTTLFGYGLGTGLDLFNAPSLKSYNFQITFKI